MTRPSKKRTGKDRKLTQNRSSSRRWTAVGLVMAAITAIAVAGWYIFDQTLFIANHEQGEAAEAIDYVHTAGDVEMPHIHGMGFSGDGRYLFVAAHDGLRIFAGERWLDPEIPRHDYMGYSVVDAGFYSSGHPAPVSPLGNPLGLVKSTDGGKTLIRLGFEGESDFHLMDVGYYNHAIYVLNPSPNSRLSVGLHYSLDDGQNWQQSALQGITTQPIAIAVHPTEANTVAMATRGGLFLSTDYGHTFTPIAQDGPATAAKFSPNGDILFFGYQKLSVFDLESETIATVATPAIAADDAISYVAINPVEQGEMAFATFSRDIYFSQDGGRTWQLIAKAGKGVKDTVSPPDLVEQGREVYLRVCANCHGQNAEGHVVAAAPALDHSEHAWHHPDQQIRDWIKHGKIGFGQMPALGDQLSDAEIETVIAYLHTLWTPEQLKTQQDITRRYGP